MTTTQQELNSFTSYAQQIILSGRHDLSIDELFDQWRTENPSDESYAENLAAINASIRDFKDGERGTIAGDHSMQLRSQFEVSDE